MRLIDLTYSIPAEEDGHPTVTPVERPLDLDGVPCTALLYEFTHGGMVGSYLDLPGHVRETDDGLTAATYPLEKLYEVPAVVAHLPRAGAPGKITAAELQAACPVLPQGGALVVHALGPQSFWEMDPGQSVALTREACQWMGERGLHLLVSDVYEHRTEKEGVFLHLFRAGIATVCLPVNLGELPDRVKLTVLAPRYPLATQFPCRVVARVG
jgi:kynurenine formamidase